MNDPILLALVVSVMTAVLSSTVVVEIIRRRTRRADIVSELEEITTTWFERLRERIQELETEVGLLRDELRDERHKRRHAETTLLEHGIIFQVAEEG